MGIDTSPRGRLGAATRACGSSAAGRSSSSTGRSLERWPDYGLSVPVANFDEMLAAHAAEGRRAPAPESTVTGPLLDDAGRVAGVHAQVGPEQGAGHLARPAGRLGRGTVGPAGEGPGPDPQREDRPLGVAVRRYVTNAAQRRRLPRICSSSRHTGPSRDSMPGYGWSSAWATGRRTSASACSTPAGRQAPTTGRSCATGSRPCRAEWELTEENAVTPLRGRRLPMALQPPAALHPRPAARR